MQSSSSADPSTVAAVVAVRDQWVAAIAERAPDRLRALLSDDYEVWANGAPALRGIDAAVAAMAGAIERFDIVQAFEPIETIISGDWAFERGIESMTVTPRAGGPSQTVRQRALLILHRHADGTWRYARGMTNALPPG